MSLYDYLLNHLGFVFGGKRDIYMYIPTVMFKPNVCMLSNSLLVCSQQYNNYS